MDYYEILHVERDATQKQIQTAYRSLMQMVHPDRNPNNPIAGESTKRINKAYQVLSNQERRAKYDRETRRTQGADEQGGQRQQRRNQSNPSKRANTNVQRRQGHQQQQGGKRSNPPKRTNRNTKSRNAAPSRRGRNAVAARNDTITNNYIIQAESQWPKIVLVIFAVLIVCAVIAGIGYLVYIVIKAIIAAIVAIATLVAGVLICAAFFKSQVQQRR